MTKREAAVVTAYTGHGIGDFRVTYDYIEQLLGRTVLYQELGDKRFQVALQRASREDFLNIEVADEPG